MSATTVTTLMLRRSRRPWAWSVVVCRTGELARRLRSRSVDATGVDYL
jgi:hypothetical protein